MPKNYEVNVIYKAGFSTIICADTNEQAKAKAINEVEMTGDHLETLGVEVLPLSEYCKRCNKRLGEEECGQSICELCSSCVGTDGEIGGVSNG